MDFEVAVEKLNSMPVEEILTRANELSCVHVVGDNKHCIIANILADLMGVNASSISVGADAVLYKDNEQRRMKEGKWSSHIIKLISQFDANPSHFVTNWAEK